MQTPAPEPGSRAGANRGSSGVRLLRGHKAAVTALHAGIRQEMGDCMGDYEDTGYFISGSADCTVWLHGTSVLWGTCKHSCSEWQVCSDITVMHSVQKHLNPPNIRLYYSLSVATSDRV